MNFANLKIGHTTDSAKSTGLTVFLFEKPATCGWWLCGSAPATRDVNLLDPACLVERIDALLFTGGSAYGLGAANGVMQWLSEQKRGFPTAHGVVPIVPTAAIYDFSVKGMAIPSAADAYQACINAKSNNSAHGRIGAGAGACIGKLLDTARPMTGGFGYAQIDCASGLSILACVVVNSTGDILNSQGSIVAGGIAKDNQFINIAESIRAGQLPQTDLSQQNTTLAAVFTNANLNKNQLARIARMASAGMARAINPVFTAYDGDVIFCASLGNVVVDEIVVGALAASAIHTAILNAVQDAVVL